jgi:hypothetical protein
MDGCERSVDDRPWGNSVVRVRTMMGTVWGGSGGRGAWLPQAARLARFFQEHLKMVWHGFRGEMLFISKAVKESEAA